MSFEQVMRDVMRSAGRWTHTRYARTSFTAWSLESLERRYLFAANIREVTSDFYDGLSVTLRGESFGSVGPTVVIFDNFERGSDGELITVGPATVGEWTGIERDIRYSGSASVSGFQSARANMAGHYRNFVEARLRDNPTEVFVSYSTLIPSGTLWPGEGHLSGINWKTVWLMGDEINDDDRILPAHLSPMGVRASEPTAHNLHANNAPPESAPGFGSLIKRGEWLHTFAWVKGRTDNTGALQLAEVTAAGVIERKNLSGLPTLYGPPPATPHSTTKPYSVFERIRMNGFGEQTSNSFPTFDDFYTATGPGARARVEIGNAPTYDACSVLAITTPTFWSDTEIRTTVRQGAFSAGQRAYLFVVSADGVASPGYPITIGAETFVSGTGWTPGFRGYLQSQGMGSSDYGFSVATRAGGPTKSLPWANVNQISIRFNREVQVGQADLTVRGVNVANYPVQSFTFNAATHVATWTLSRTVGKDRVTASLNSRVTGAAVVVPLEFLPGDTDRSGSVLANDFSDTKRRFFRTTVNPGVGPTAYSAFHDVNGDGTILADDASFVKRQFFTILPTAAPAARLSTAATSGVGPLTRDLFDVDPLLT